MRLPTESEFDEAKRQFAEAVERGDKSAMAIFKIFETLDRIMNLGPDDDALEAIHAELERRYAALKIRKGPV